LLEIPAFDSRLVQLEWSRIELKLAGSFRTSKVTRTDKETLWVRIHHEGVTGWGEATPVDTYHQTVESAETTLRDITRWIVRFVPFDLDEVVSQLLRRFPGQLATIAAVDAALNDWIGQKAGMPTVRLLGLNPMLAPLTSFSIGIDTPDLIESRLASAAEFPILKIKLGSSADEETLSLIRKKCPGKTLRVDANAGWTLDEAVARLPLMAKHDVEFVEQPLAANDHDGLRRLKDMAIRPIIADESCVRPADVLKIAGCVDGINIKLSKCGGIREALKMIHLARAHSLKVMLGCMIESSLGIAAAAQLAPLADWIDLDGHLLIRNDPFQGLGGHAGRLTIGCGPGLGISKAV